MAALPLVSGPISAFLAMENGAVFAVNAAMGPLAGTVALAFFGLVYAVFCPASRVLALFVLCVACLAVGSRLIPVAEETEARPAPLQHDIILRMALMAVTMALFAQRDGRHAGEAQKVMKGFVSGLTSAAVFYLVLSSGLPAGKLLAGYLEATAAALFVQGVIFWVLCQRNLV